jgi:thiol-disulfide isomerase/thioredoxin
MKNDYTILSGTINNYSKKEFVLVDIDRTFSKKISLNSDNTFTDTLRVESGIYSFYVGKKNIDLQITKGENLKLTYDIQDNNKISFNGANSIINNYLFKKGVTKKELFGNASDMYALEEQDFINKTTSDEKSLTALISEFNLDASFSSQEKRDAHYTSISNYNNYESFHNYYAKKKNFKVSASFPNELKEIDRTNVNDFKNLTSYRTLVEAYYHKIIQDTPNLNDDLYNFTYMSIVNKEVKSKIIKNQLLFDNAKYGITFTTEPEAFYKEYIASTSNKIQQEEITKTFTILQKTAKGKESPKFVDYENYKGGTTSLEDLKGKYIYIDVWATWCGPCKAEIPSLKKVEKKYHNKNIEFVSISIDKTKDYDAWRKMIADKELKGVQLIADKDWKSAFVKEYHIQGIPRFILIDPQGKVVKSSAPRPSSTELIDLFTELDI